MQADYQICYPSCCPEAAGSQQCCTNTDPYFVTQLGLCSNTPQLSISDAKAGQGVKHPQTPMQADHQIGRANY